MEENDKSELPSKKAERKQQEEKERKELQEQQIAALREDFGRTFQTEHGKRVLAWFADRCGWGKLPLGAGPDGNIDPIRTTFNAMELSLYTVIRGYISTDVLMEVEYGSIKPSGHIEHTGKRTRRSTSKSSTRRK